MSILQGTIVWTGFPGAPGYTNLHITNAGILSTALNNFMTGMNKFVDDLHSALPNIVRLSPSTEVKELDAATGALIALHTPTVAPVPFLGSGGTNYSAPSGCCISWGTGGVNRGHRVKGKTFVVPLAGTAYDTDGSIVSGFLGPLNSAALNWRTSAAYESLIWSRPRLGAGGAAFPITSHNIADKAAVLRSRRP